MSVQLGKSWRGQTQVRLMTAFAAMFLFYTGAAHAQGIGGIQLTGDVLQFVLPGTGAGLALEHRDWQGVRQLAEAAGLTFAITESMRFGIDERRRSGKGKERT